MKTLRHWLYLVLAIPVVTVLVAFGLAQSQLIRLVGNGAWSLLLWPNLEWVLGAGLIALAYRRDWPRWTWIALVQMWGEAVVAVLVLIVLLWTTGTTLAFGTWDWSALVSLLSIAPALFVWCLAEETVLRGAAGRHSSGYRPIVQPLAMIGAAAVVTVLMQPISSGLLLVSVIALEVLSVVGFLAGNSLVLLAARRWFVRLVIVACGIPGVGFVVHTTPLAQLSALNPILGMLVMGSLCVLWSCIVAIRWVRSESIRPSLQQNVPTDV